MSTEKEECFKKHTVDLSDYQMVDFREYERYVNKTVVVVLKSLQFLYGSLKSYDQYNNISLNFTTQRIFHENTYAEKNLGLVSVRGENVVVIAVAEFDLDGLEKVEYNHLETKLLKYLDDVNK
ncbi:LSM1 [Enterospora canceri]|uniref:LSM1 n=1 Tax=Enterospora canceri TaxID=1081671 RepID=A0A1Y1S897_9MICR|nr:LSM1 [Enterospora canceri]